MAVTGTRNARAIITSAMRLAGIVDADNPAQNYEIAIGLTALNDMLKSWQQMGYNVWTMTAGSLTLTSAASYTLSPVRPLRILSARFKRGSIEVPMIELMRQEYDALPQKDIAGQPTQFYYDRQREAAVFYVWPLLESPAGETVEFTYTREMEDITALNAVLDIPAEWYEAVKYNLAPRIAEELGRAAPANVEARAIDLLDQAKSFDTEGSVFMGEESQIFGAYYIDG